MYECSYTRIGYHVSLKWLLQQSDEYFKDHKVFQVFVGNPQSLEPGHVTDYAIFKHRHPEVEVYVHCSYPTNLCKSPADKITQSTLRYLILHSRQLGSVGCKYLIMHTGSRAETDDIKQSMVYLWGNVQKWIQATYDIPIKLLLENDVGSKKGTRMGNVKALSMVVSKCDRDKVGICLDTEHSFGSGFDFSTVHDYDSYIDLVHLNSVPQDVEFGSHKDRHTSTTFYESQDVVNTYIDYVLDTGSDAIMEVDMALAPDNYKYLEEVYNGKIWTKCEF